MDNHAYVKILGEGLNSLSALFLTSFGIEGAVPEI